MLRSLGEADGFVVDVWFKYEVSFEEILFILNGPQRVQHRRFCLRFPNLR